MIHTHSLGRAARSCPERTALVSDGRRITFRELHDRVANIAAALRRQGFGPGDRLPILLPIEPEYIELVYACAWLGAIAVPLNTRLSSVELDHILTDAEPHGLIQHSSLPSPTAEVPWRLTLDEKPLTVALDSNPDVFYDPGAALALIHTSGTTGSPKGGVVAPEHVPGKLHHSNYWIPCL